MSFWQTDTISKRYAKNTEIPEFSGKHENINYTFFCFESFKCFYKKFPSKIAMKIEDELKIKTTKNGWMKKVQKYLEHFLREEPQK